MASVVFVIQMRTSQEETPQEMNLSKNGVKTVSNGLTQVRMNFVRTLAQTQIQTQTQTQGAEMVSQSTVLNVGSS
jgi:hypothetical protein